MPNKPYSNRLSAALPKAGILVTILALFGSTLSAQVNTEKIRKESQKQGFQNTLSLNFGLSEGNTQHASLQVGFRTDYLKQKHHVFLSSSLNNAQKGGVNYKNKGFSHLRYTHKTFNRVHLESFTQREFDDFVNLKERQLVGGGIRIPLAYKQSFSMRIGTGVMYEYEKSTTELTQENIRSTSYISLQKTLKNKATISATGYFQPVIDRFQDHRLLFEGHLSAPLSERIFLTLDFNLKHDNDPQPGIEKTDFELQNGIKLAF